MRAVNCRDHNQAFTLVALNLAIGACYLLQSPNRERSDAYANAKHVTAWLPWMSALRWWGILFVIGAALVVVLHTSQIGLRLAASFALGVWIFWAALLATSSLLDGKSGYVGPVLFAAGAIWHARVARGR